MAGSAIILVLSLAVTAHAVSNGNRGVVGAERQKSLLQTYDQELNGNGEKSKAQNTPVTRVVNLLKEMKHTIEKEQEEDDELYHKLSCWCNNNKYEKTEASDEASSKISDLEATIEALSAKSKELMTKIAELEAGVAADKAALAEATALREKQLKEFHSLELDDIAAIENLKAAIVVLSKHDGAAFPQIPLSLLQNVKGKQEPFAPEHESHLSHSFDEFLRKQSFDMNTHAASTPSAPTPRFLQDKAPDATALHGWSAADVSTVKRAVASASALLQRRHSEGYYPSYHAQSGEIFGVLKQLKEEMEADLGEAQKTEALRAAAFAELRSAKTSEIESGEKMAETKEDELAQTDNDLAEAKEDLGQTQTALSEDQKFLANLGKTCAEADANFEARKKSRLEEIQAVSQTITILTGDEARDAMDVTFSLIQTSSKSDKLRKDAAAVLRQTAQKTHSPALSMLASSVELDAFTKVKAMIDKMIVQLKAQQADEVKKNDWCTSELQENEMATMKTKDLKADLEAKIAQLESTIKTLSEEIEKAHLDISDLRVSMQRASENRKAENLDFQKVVADQMVTAEILGKALDKLATYYDEAAFAQTQKHKQTPPVPQMEYTKSSGASGVMSLIEKLIYDTKDITAKSKKSESEAQAAYEALIADTNDSIDNLTKEITTKTKAKAAAKKDLTLTQGDHADAVTELENLGKYNADMHAECDYVMKNFGIRQNARAEEIEALQQAKQILDGASLN
jgi:chromosome segregation ATPase